MRDFVERCASAIYSRLCVLAEQDALRSPAMIYDDPQSIGADYVFDPLKLLYGSE